MFLVYLTESSCVFELPGSIRWIEAVSLSRNVSIFLRIFCRDDGMGSRGLVSNFGHDGVTLGRVRMRGNICYHNSALKGSFRFRYKFALDSVVRLHAPLPSPCPFFLLYGASSSCSWSSSPATLLTRFLLQVLSLHLWAARSRPGLFSASLSHSRLNSRLLFSLFRHRIPFATSSAIV